MDKSCLMYLDKNDEHPLKKEIFLIKNLKKNTRWSSYADQPRGQPKSSIGGRKVTKEVRGEGKYGGGGTSVCACGSGWPPGCGASIRLQQTCIEGILDNAHSKPLGHWL